ncbi:MAG: hypothetical protein GF332_04765 [Candidatus Moranbacteria bacterium]|nr:hypothetical protein [Candidatus Moranbacteria bacterium]
MIKHTTIYVEPQEEITSVIERIKKTPASRIAVVIPLNSSISSGIINLKILANESSKIGKKTILVTRDSQCRTLAKKAGLITARKVTQDLFSRFEKPKPDTLTPNDQAQTSTTSNRVKSSFVTNSVSPAGQQIPDHRSSFNPISAKSIDSLSRSQSREPLDLTKLSKTKPADSSTSTLTPASNSRITADKQDHPIQKPNPDQELNQEPKPKPDFQSNQIAQSQAEKLPNQNSESFPRQFSRKKAITAKKSFQATKELRSKSSLISSKTSKADSNKIKQNLFDREKKVSLIPLFNLQSTIIISVIVAILLVIGSLYFLIPIKIIIHPKTQELSFQQEFTVNFDQGQKTNDQTIIGRQIEKTIQVKKSFPATQETEPIDTGGKVTGFVTIYNQYSRNPEVLIPETRLTNDQGLTFKLISKVRIPGLEKTNDQVVPGQAQAQIVAQEQGDEYLIDQGTLNFPGLADTDRYDKIYAEITQPLQKPQDLPKTQISQQDYNQAKTEVQSAIQEKLAHFDFELESDLVGVSDQTSSKKIQYQASHPVGSPVQEFSLQGETTATILAYSQGKLEQLAQEFLKQKVNQNDQELVKTVNIELLTKNYNLDSKQLKIKLKIKAQTRAKINLQDLKTELTNLKKQEVNDQLARQDKIMQTEIKRWPFWHFKTPKNPDKIKLTIPE